MVDFIAFPSRRRRLLFLGPLPHALASIDALKMQFAYMKGNASQRLQDADDHRKLEDLGRAVVAVE